MDCVDSDCVDSVDCVDSDIEMDTDTSSVESDTEDTKEWIQAEQDLQRLTVLQTEVCERLTALSVMLSQKPSDSTMAMSAIQQCHIESLKELELTGVVTFGQRLLSVLNK